MRLQSRPTVRRHCIVFSTAATLAFAAAASGQSPVINSVDDDTLEPGGFVVVRGSSFGSQEGGLLFGGSRALVSSWNDSEVRAWVPADVSVGAIDLRVVDADGDRSAPLAVEMSPRTPDGRVLWRTVIDGSEPSLHAPATAADGTVYVDDPRGRLYAVSPDGDIRWVYRGGPRGQGGGNEGPIAVGEDGRIYWAYNPLGPALEVHAVRPDGSTFPIGFRQSPLVDNEGDVTGSLIVFQDLTELFNDRQCFLRIRRTDDVVATVRFETECEPKRKSFSRVEPGGLGVEA